MKKLLFALAVSLWAFPVSASSTLYSDSVTGFVGIGTSSPAGVVDVETASSGNTDSLALFYGLNLSNGNRVSLRLGKGAAVNNEALIQFQQGSTASILGIGFNGDNILGGTGLIIQKGVSVIL